MSLQFNRLQSDLLLGTLLGDGNLSTENGQTWRYRALHKAQQKDYLYHKYNLLKEYCETEPLYQEGVDKRTKQSYSRYYFNTLTSDAFRYYGQLFYKKSHDGDWKKEIPKNIASLLTAQAVAYWYMDDGALKWEGRSNAIRFCTDGFSVSDVKLLKSALEKNFNLKVSLQKIRENTRLCILEKSFIQFNETIVPYIRTDFYYKVPDGKKGTLKSSSINGDIHSDKRERDNISRDLFL